MTAPNVLFLILTAFFAVALLLIYNAYYKPVSSSGVGRPSVSDQPTTGLRSFQKTT